VVLSDARSLDAAADLGLRQAAFVVSRVVSRPEPDRVTLDAGSKALSPDRSPPGAVLGWRAVEALAVSEEHWSVRLVGAEPPALGALVWVVPSHVCTTVNLHRQVLYLRQGRLAGEGVVEAAGHTPWVS
jgi:D-serine deaminase-like pyridoxal phosphate-dependent protein